MKHSDRIIALLNAFNPDIGAGVTIKKTRRGVKITSPLAEYVIEVGDDVGCGQDHSGVNVCVVTPELVEPGNRTRIESLLRRLFVGDPDLHPQLSAKEIRLTDPQFECLDAFENSLMEGESAGAIVLPTAMGKTVVAAFAVEMARETIDARTVLFLANQTELLDSAYGKFQNLIPDWTLSRFYGARREVPDGDVVLATVQSSDRLKGFDRDYFDLVIVDEFHHVMSDTYKELFRHFTPKYRLGLSATPFRGDRQDPVSAFDGNYLCHKVLKDVVVEGYVSPPDWRLIQDVTDYSGIFSPATGKEVTAVSAARELIVPEREAIILDAYRRLSIGRTVGFCYGLPHARRMTQVFRAAGVRADIFTGEHSSVNGVAVKDRKKTLEAFRRGDTRVLFTVDLFNEGVDVPEIETVLFLRATTSPGRLLQNIGRGLRLAPGKRAVRVLDFMSNYDRAEALVNLGKIIDLGGGGSARPENTGGGGDGIDRQLIEMGIEIKVTEEAKRLIRDTLKEIESRQQINRQRIRPPRSPAETESIFACYENEYQLGRNDRELSEKCGGTKHDAWVWRNEKNLPAHGRRDVSKLDRLKAHVRRLHSKGHSDKRMAEEIGVSKTYVQTLRTRMGLPANKGSTEGQYGSRMRELYDKGWDDQRIAEAIGATRNLVAVWRRKEGLASWLVPGGAHFFKKRKLGSQNPPLLDDGKLAGGAPEPHFSPRRRLRLT